MSSLLFIGILSGYFLVLLGISWITSRKADDQSYFLGNKTSPWIAVAFGLIGDSLSGVTFISVPGAVGGNQFTYFQLVLGYLFGYFIIAGILLPLYYKYNLTSIYTYLGQRFGSWAEKTGSFFFLLSRSLGAAARLYLAAGVIQIFIFDALGVPFWLSVSVTIILILVYTMKGGIRTLVWTDTFQSTFLLLGVILSIIAITTQLGWSPGEILNKIVESEHSKMFFWDWKLKSFFPK